MKIGNFHRGVGVWVCRRVGRTNLAFVMGVWK